VAFIRSYSPILFQSGTGCVTPVVFPQTSGPWTTTARNFGEAVAWIFELNIFFDAEPLQCKVETDRNSVSVTVPKLT